jgi:hypothetical protein
MLTLALRKFFTLKPTRQVDSDPKVSIVLSIGILVTQVADYLSTKIGLTAVNATETNSIMGQFITKYGWDAFLQLKLAAVAFLIWTCWKRPLVGAGIVVLYSAVVLNNLYAILRHLS